MIAGPLDPEADVVTLTAALCDIESVSLGEGPIADAVEAALRAFSHLEVTRLGNTVVARSDLGRDSRVVLAGHLDTVPVALDPPNLPTRLVQRDGHQVLAGRGTVDMKGGIAVMLRLAALLKQPSRDLTFAFYDAEEIASEFNGLGRLAQARPDLINDADFAVLLEPTGGAIEGGCNGTLRAQVRASGVAAHSARPWKGVNAIHGASPILNRLVAYQPRTLVVDSLEYREALNAVLIDGGTATNVIPDACVVTVNYRYAPSATPEQAEEYVREVFDGFEVTITDNAPGARPGLDLPAARDFVAAVSGEVRAKLGWTDVSRFAGLGIPAVNYGPGDPSLAHMDDEAAPIDQYRDAEASLLAWLR